MANKQKAKMLIFFFLIGIVLVLSGIINFAYCAFYGGRPYLLFLAIPGFILIVTGCCLLSIDYYEKKE